MMQSASGAAFASPTTFSVLREYDCLALRAVTDKAAANFGYHGHTVAHLQPGNLSLFSARVRIYDEYFAPVRQVQAPRVGVEGDVIEILTISRRCLEFIGVHQVIVDRGCGGSRHAEHQDAEHDAIAKCRFHRLLPSLAGRGTDTQTSHGKHRHPRQLSHPWRVICRPRTHWKLWAATASRPNAEKERPRYPAI